MEKYKYIFSFFLASVVIWWSLSRSYNFRNNLQKTISTASTMEICLISNKTVTDKCVERSPFSSFFSKIKVSEPPSKTPTQKEYRMRFLSDGGNEKCVIVYVYERIPEHVFIVPTNKELECEYADRRVGGIVQVSRDVIKLIEDKIE